MSFSLLFCKENISVYVYLSWQRIHNQCKRCRNEIKWFRWNKMLTPWWHSCNIFICICCKFVWVEPLQCLYNDTHWEGSSSFFDMSLSKATHRERSLKKGKSELGITLDKITFFYIFTSISRWRVHLLTKGKYKITLNYTDLLTFSLAPDTSGAFGFATWQFVINLSVSARY